MYQHSLLKPLRFTGIGLHSGQEVQVRFVPAPVNSGLTFVRTDLSQDGVEVSLKPSAGAVTYTQLCTRLSDSGSTQLEVSTIEHLMAALRAAGVDNLRIELDGPEFPILDGSSAPLLFLLQCCGLQAQEAPRRAIKILEPIEVEDGDRRAAFYPHAGALFDFSIDFAHPAIGKQSYRFDLVRDSFERDLSRARTFGFRKDIEALWAKGLGRGGSQDNALVLDSERILNPEGLRYPDEFVRHKVLDAIGDTYIEGLPIIGHYVGHKAGHGVTAKLMQTLKARPHAWIYTQDLSALMPTGSSQLVQVDMPRAVGL